MIIINTNNINHLLLEDYCKEIRENIKKSVERVYKVRYAKNKDKPFNDDELKKCLKFLDIDSFVLKDFTKKDKKYEPSKRYEPNINIEVEYSERNHKFNEFIIGKIDNIDYYENIFNQFNINGETEKFLKEVMDYSKIIKDKSIWSDGLNLKVCPYCNRQYIFEYKYKNEKKYVTYELDHFYSKDKYFYLSCSFFNLVPSCRNCNKVKSNIDNEKIYPYKEQFGGLGKFVYDVDDISVFYGSRNLEGLTIKINTVDSSMKTKIENSVELFHLEEVYNHHKDLVLDILFKHLKYNKSYIESLTNDYKLFEENEVMSNIFFEYSQNEITNIPFAKLHNDIVSLIKSDNEK